MQHMDENAFPWLGTKHLTENECTECSARTFFMSYDKVRMTAEQFFGYIDQNILQERIQ